MPNAGNTFGGVPAAQAWNDLALWEVFFTRYPCASVIELGTWRGGMALFLALQAKARAMRLVSIERSQGIVECAPLLTELGCELLELNLLSAEGPNRMKELIEDLPKPRLLFCDNGNKREETRLFVPLLAANDCVAVHDWGAEIGPEDIFWATEPFMQSECENSRSLTRFFLVAEKG